LNSKYLNRQDFYLIPCDGLYSRDVQKALVFALQYEQGMADGVANGSFGPATQTGMKQATAQLSLGTSDANTKKNFVRLYQAALRFNTYYQIPFNGIFDVATQRETLTFQGFSVLPTTGSADFATWASLLVSTGDTTRPTAGCDARDEITEARSTTLRSQSPPIMTVGRYIANVPGGYNKKIQPNEIATLFSHGMKFWPIFQMYANSLDHISRTSGLSDGAAAHVAADGYNLPAGTIIYFAIDFDATGEQISSNVIPYFQGVQQALRTKGGKYRVGVYGSRNVCAQASIQAGAVSSFVSGMSTGFSGNLGFPLPRNWAFDQIANVTIGSGSGQIEIDRNVIRGGNADQGVSSLEAPAGNQAVIAWLRALEAEAEEYIRNSGPGTDRPNFRGPMHLVANYIRSLEPGYSGGAFAILMGGDIIDGFKDQIVAKGIAPFLQIRDSDLNGPVDLPHLMVAAEAVLANGATYPGMDSLDNSFLSDMAGWAGDLVSMVSTYLNSAAIFNGETSLASAYDFMLAGIGTTYNSETKFGPTDIIEDVDGASMAMLWEQGKASSLSLEMEGLYTGTQWTNRYTRFFQLRFGGSWDTATRAVKDVFNSDVVTLVGAARTRVYYAEQVNQDLITDEVKEGFAQAWVEVLRRRVALEG
jgi:peptidoglycan hydrolase-like protein with peptidoglycan-binding domain